MQVAWQPPSDSVPLPSPTYLPFLLLPPPPAPCPCRGPSDPPTRQRRSRRHSCSSTKASPQTWPRGGSTQHPCSRTIAVVATFRFVVTDEESQKPRILLWLFNPSVNISYRHVNGQALPSSRLNGSANGNGHHHGIDTKQRPGMGSRRSSQASVKSVTSRSMREEIVEKSIKAASVMYKVVQNGSIK